MWNKKKIKSSKATRDPKVNRHFVFIEAPVKIVAKQVMSWGTGDWWPADAPLKFVTETEGELREGSRQRVEPVKGKGPTWQVEVTKIIPRRLIERTFLSGMFLGYELIKIGERANGTRIDYELHFLLKGVQDRLLWPLMLEKKHDRSIDAILLALKDHCERIYQDGQIKTTEQE